MDPIFLIILTLLMILIGWITKTQIDDLYQTRSDIAIFGWSFKRIILIIISLITTVSSLGLFVFFVYVVGTEVLHLLGF